MTRGESILSIEHPGSGMDIAHAMYKLRERMREVNGKGVGYEFIACTTKNAIANLRVWLVDQ